jgi:hypothetical protein
VRRRVGSRVVLLQGVPLVQAGTRGIVKRDTGRITIVALDDGRIVSVRSDLLVNDSQATPTRGESTQ